MRWKVVGKMSRPSMTCLILICGIQYLIAQDVKTPKEIVFPSIRNFDHPSKILTQGGEDYTTVRMASKADDNRMMLLVDFGIKDFATKGKTPSLLGIGEFQFVGQYDNWDKISPKTIALRIDGRETKLECSRSGEMLEAAFDLDFFPSILAAKSVRIKIADIDFELEERHLEAMRDLASRLPDGKSTNGLFIISHAPDIEEEPEKPKTNSSAKAKAKLPIESKVNKSDKDSPEVKTRRAQSFVDSGKILLKNGNSAAAKKQFEKAILEDPESSIAKEAKGLIDKLP